MQFFFSTTYVIRLKCRGCEIMEREIHKEGNLLINDIQKH